MQRKWTPIDADQAGYACFLPALICRESAFRLAFSAPSAPPRKSHFPAAKDHRICSTVQAGSSVKSVVAFFPDEATLLGRALSALSFEDQGRPTGGCTGRPRREERWLAERYPAYATYQQRVRKLIPFVY